MKKCVYCEREFPDSAITCAVDGQMLRPVPSAVPAPFPTGDGDRRKTDEEHIRLLAIFHFIAAGLAFCGIGLIVVHYLIMSNVFFNPDFLKSPSKAPVMPKEFFKIFIALYVFMGLMLATAALGNALSGIFLLQRKHRIFSIVISALNCLQIPFGTVLGTFTIIVLSRESVRKIY